MIELYDSIQDRMMPDDVRSLSDKYSSITTSGNPSLGEDFDFILEEKNKQLKSWIPKGVPSDKIWLTVCRNNKILEMIKEHCLKLFQIKSEKQDMGKARSLGIDDAIVVYRMLLRRSDYLGKKGDHVSISGIALDEELTDFSKLALTKRIHLFKTEFLGLPVLPEHCSFRHPVAVTPSEKQKFQSTNSMTVKQLQHEIEKLLDRIEDKFQLDYHKELYQQEVKTKRKAKLVHFLNELKVVMDAQETHSMDLATLLAE
ncbi:unnamed protein product [Mytilus edulis]|uniref:Uncharacterized protein n=1 Tax=Mytilus edulis TaxID=6550 RepID=A0A8S3PXQ1_MYTED|nr:unnamed protein product [Mytilus edulis]